MSAHSDPTPATLPDVQHVARLNRLVEAATPAEVGQVIVSMAAALPDCRSARLLGDACDMPCTEVSSEEFNWAQKTIGARSLRLSEDGLRAAWCLLPHERVIVLMHFDRAQEATRLQATLQEQLTSASRQLLRVIELADLHDSHRQLERSEQLQRALFAISDLAGSDQDMHDMLRGVHAIIARLMYGENLFIVKRDPDRDTLRFLYYADTQDTEEQDPTRETPLAEWRGTLTHYLLTHGQPLMGSAEELRAQIVGPLLHVGPESVDWLGVPMLLNGAVMGALVVQSYEQGKGFSEDDKELLSFVGSHILTALERKQSKEQLEQRVLLRTQELAEANRGLQQQVLERQRAEALQAALFQLAQLATADIDETEFYTRVHSVVDRLLNAKNFFIALLSDDRRQLDIPFFVEGRLRDVPAQPLARGLSEYVLRMGKPFLAQRADIDALVQSGEVVSRVMGEPATSWLGVPLRAGDEVIGLVTVQSLVPEVSYDESDLELLSFAAMQIANSIYRRRTAASLHLSKVQLEQRVHERTQELRQQIKQREEVQQQLKHQVMHDPLTGLPNRDYLRARLDRVLNLLQGESDHRCALLYLDIDRFKVVNDSLGHLAGDEFLKAISARLQECVREPDMVARLAGDEFAVLLENIQSATTATRVAQRILQKLGKPLNCAGKDMQPSASVGIAIGDGSYRSSDDLLRHADIALYRAKERGRNRFEMFDDTLARDLVDVLTLETELRHALHHDEFEPWFQPICRLDGGAVAGYEALIRWIHPQRGALLPADFLRIAEDSGLIEAIDWRMFQLSCTQFQQLEGGDTFVSINVSARHLRHADFDTRLLQLLASTGLPPARLLVEVTEGALLDNPAHVRAILARLRDAGVRAALDDFGTGYSSLSYLHSLPLGMLKIDQVFVQDLNKPGNIDSTPVVASIFALAQALEIGVIAEGIETPAQYASLHDMGCAMAQGYLLGRAAPLAYWLDKAAEPLPRSA